MATIVTQMQKRSLLTGISLYCHGMSSSNFSIVASYSSYPYSYSSYRRWRA